MHETERVRVYYYNPGARTGPGWQQYWISVSSAYIWGRRPWLSMRSINAAVYKLKSRGRGKDTPCDTPNRNVVGVHWPVPRSDSGSVSGNVIQRISRHTVVTLNSDGRTCNAEAGEQICAVEAWLPCDLHPHPFLHSLSPTPEQLFTCKLLGENPPTPAFHPNGLIMYKFKMFILTVVKNLALTKECEIPICLNTV